MNPPAILRWKDGREQPTPHGAGVTIVVPRFEDGGRYLETRFEVQPPTSWPPTEEHPLVFLETVTEDKTEAMRRAERENHERTMRVFRRGLDGR